MSLRTIPLGKDTPFQVTPDAIRTGLALFEKPAADGRSEIALILDPSGDPAGTANMWSLTHPNNTLLATGSAERSRNRRSDAWETKIAASEKLNPVQIRAIRSDVQTALQKAADDLPFGFSERLFDEEEDAESTDNRRTETTAVIRRRR